MKVGRLHLDSSSFHVHGEYASGSVELSVEVNQETSDSSESQTTAKRPNITHGYSRDHRPNLKQFIIGQSASFFGDAWLATGSVLSY